MKTKTNSGIKLNANVKAGALTPNHVRSGLRIKAGIKAGGTLRRNHASRVLSA